MSAFFASLVHLLLPSLFELQLPLAAATSPSIQLTFSALVEKTEFAPWTDWIEERTTGQLVSDQAMLGLRTRFSYPDGRSGAFITRYGDSDRLKGQYRVTPFFNESVCFIFSLPQYSPPVPGEEAWSFDVFDNLIGASESVLKNAKEGPMSLVDGVPCQIYTALQQKGDPAYGENISYSICIGIGIGRELLAANATTTFSWDSKAAFSTRVFRNYSALPDPGLLTPPQKGCVNLTMDKDDISDAELINQPSRILALNKAAGGSWRAGANSVFEGVTFGRAKKEKVGTRIGALQRLPLNMISSNIDVPSAFDARENWHACLSTGRIRNQGTCGSCWAFAASEVFADRVCIAGGASNLTLSPEYLVDCDVTESGCGGGYLDDVWHFLARTGVTTEACDPYQHCPYPETQTCQKPSSTWSAGLPFGSAKTSCPTHCQDGMALQRVQASSAYAVAMPGDVLGMQREIATRGPIQVAFFVFSDFMNYKNGTYFWTRTPGLVGGHAVRVLGWGKDNQEVPYWLTANSWGPEWGMKGFFHVRRGTNECGFESTPAAGGYQAHLVV